MRSASGLQDMLLALGPQAASILDLWRLTLIVCTIVFALVLIGLAWALWRAPRGSRDTPPDLRSLSNDEAAPRRSVRIATGVSIALLLGLLVASIATDRALAQLNVRDALHIELTGHQWWWSMHYQDADVSREFDTANELHLPAGRPVIVTLGSADVIHSLWVPSLAGKKDLIPGRTTTLALRADKPGLYRGQCAEFCGYQHAWMALPVIVDEPAQYEAWAARQRENASTPSGALAQRGEALVTGSDCVMCHSIRGTGSGARQAPDLTHLASRSTIAAGALPNDAAHLAAWITDPSVHKPGANMPGHSFSSEELQAIVAYLGSLK
jgi:cytochrome c oxidase subunit 2